jgi:hypothetical protein
MGHFVEMGEAVFAGGKGFGSKSFFFQMVGQHSGVHFVVVHDEYLLVFHDK